MPNANRINPLVRTAVGSVLLAAGARLSIPFWPVPLTLQTMVLAIIGLAFGPWLGLASVVLYLCLGLFGMPVFAGGGGPAYAFTPGFGFLLGFVPAVAVTGLIGRLRGNRPAAVRAVAALCGLPPLYAVGVLYYGLIKSAYGRAPFWTMLAPFLIYIPGDFIKAMAASAVAGVLKKRFALDGEKS